MLDALRLGTHQLLSMRVPDHAAISTTVDLVRARVNTGAGGFANAVLRTVSEHDLDEWIDRVAPDARASPTRYAAIAYSHPEWVVDELRDAVGAGRAARPARRRQRESPRSRWWPGPAARPVTSCRASRRRTRRTAWCSTAATPAPCRRSPRGGPASRTRARSWSRWRWPTRRSRAATGSGSTCAPAPAARPRCWRRSPPSAARRWSPTSGCRHRAGLVRRTLAPTAAVPGVAGVVAADGTGRRTAPAASTGCWSTRPAPASARCAAGPRRGGGASPTTWSRW